jgi:hypothetical protein
MCTSAIESISEMLRIHPSNHYEGRLSRSAFHELTECLRKHQLPVGDGHVWERLFRIRQCYEPLLVAMADYFIIELPAWLPPAKSDVPGSPGRRWHPSFPCHCCQRPMADHLSLLVHPLLRWLGNPRRVPARTTATDRRSAAHFGYRFWQPSTAVAAAVFCPVAVSDRRASASGSRDREADCWGRAALLGL